MGCWDREWRLMQLANRATELMEESVQQEVVYETRFEKALHDVITEYFDDEEGDVDVHRVLDGFPLRHQNAYVRFQAQHPTTTVGLAKMKGQINIMAAAHRRCQELSQRLTETKTALQQASEARDLAEDDVAEANAAAQEVVEPKIPTHPDTPIDSSALAYSSGVRKGFTKDEHAREVERARLEAKREKERRGMRARIKEHDAKQARAHHLDIEEHLQNANAEHDMAREHWERNKKVWLKEGLVAYLEPYLAIREAQTVALREVLKAAQEIDPEKNMFTAVPANPKPASLPVSCTAAVSAPEVDPARSPAQGPAGNASAISQ